MRYRRLLSNRHVPQKGFTIIEFMVATVVFCIVMMATATAIAAMAKQYQKSMNVSRTQAAARRITDRISEELKFSSGDITTGAATNTQAVCLEGMQIMYTTGRKVGASGATGTLHGAVLRSVMGCPTINITTTATIPGAQELLGPGMRLSKLAVTSSGPSMFTVTARVVYGDDDLLCRPSFIATATGGCSPTAPVISAADLTAATATDLTCKSGAGSEYCAVSEVSNTVSRRVD